MIGPASVREWQRLTPATARFLPASVRRPRFDRARLRPGILHLGVGAFHRCHQADYTDDALEASFGDWGIVGVNLRPPDLDSTIGAQGGLYCRELRESGKRERRLIGSILATISASGRDADHRPLMRALAVAADPTTRVITLTVTEKGYCHIPATGDLDENHPDIVHDLDHPDLPVSVPGFLLRALALRFAGGTPPPAILSCDNVPDNGATLRRCVLALAARTDPGLAERVATEVDFPNTMVDRIAPATRDEDLDLFAADTGIFDRGLVVGEPFRMWVIENAKGLALPAWDSAGALFVDDAAPFEILKMRVLNGIQSNVCQLGLLSGFEFMSDVMADDVFVEQARRTITEEVLPNLPEVPGIDVQAYLVATIRRLKNPDLKHGTLQISTDGSQKIKQRLLEPIRAALKAGTRFDGLLLGVAGWMQYASGFDCRGRDLDVRDPMSDATKEIGAATQGNPGGLVARMLGIEAIFGTDLRSNGEVGRRLTELVAALQTKPAKEVVAELLANA